MLKWILVLVVAIVVLSLFAPQFARFGLGRLPGDVVFEKGNSSFYLNYACAIQLQFNMN
jgi:hypothetical protein